jgi:uncharacterized protein YjdB
VRDRLLVALIALCASCAEHPTQPKTTNSLTITPVADTVATGDTVRLGATLKDDAGNVLTGHPVTWTSSDITVATVSGSGLVTGVAAGQATITASSEEARNSAVVTVRPPVASVTVTPATASVVIPLTLQLTATPKDAGGNVLTGLHVAWGSNRPAWGTVSPTGLVTAVAETTFATSVTITITAAVGGASGTARITVLPSVASVAVTPNTVSIVAGSSVQLTAIPRDQYGHDLADRVVTWATDNPTAATVSNAGLVTAVSHGSATITATSEGRTGTAQITLVSVASVTVAPETVSVVHGGGTAQLTATLRDSVGDVLTSGAVTWSSSSPGVATAAALNNRTVIVTGAASGTATIKATSEAASDSAMVVVLPPLSFTNVSTGSVHTCAVTTAGDAYCWGGNVNDGGELGTGSSRSSSTSPTPVSGGLTFAAVSPALTHSCGITATGAAYCWGVDSTGELGTGSGDLARIIPTPAPVQGGLTFVTLATASAFYVYNSGALLVGFGGNTCGITADSAAYCWGANDEGQLGVGSTSGLNGCWNPCSPIPVAVTGGLRFFALSVGVSFTCGLAGDSTAYCWGNNYFGTLGDSTTYNSSVPIPVAGGLHFKSINAGYGAVCGLTAGGTAYCWGTYATGSYGTTPTAVPGGLTFRALSSGSVPSCGITSSGAAYCWDGYQGTPINPTLVPGGLSFTSISNRRTSGGYGHTCGRATDGFLYCWGANYSGQLGDGTTTDRSTPVKVLGQ